MDDWWHHPSVVRFVVCTTSWSRTDGEQASKNQWEDAVSISCFSKGVSFKTSKQHARCNHICVVIRRISAHHSSCLGDQSLQVACKVTCYDMSKLTHERGCATLPKITSHRRPTGSQTHIQTTFLLHSDNICLFESCAQWSLNDIGSLCMFETENERKVSSALRPSCVCKQSALPGRWSCK